MSAGPSEVIRVGALGIRFLVESDDSNGSAAVFECEVPTGAGPPAPHSHDAYEETIYGLAGITTWTVEGRVTEIGPGEAICIRRGEVHHFDNRAGENAKFLAVVSPGVLGPEFFREMGAVVAAATGAPADRRRIGEVMRRHGLTPAPPAGGGP
jgi:quercetin dioxygenase-like cupin family protein